MSPALFFLGQAMSPALFFLGQAMSHLIRELLKRWREHIAYVYELRGREREYVPLEVFHTCHGCGAGSGIITRGLCERCNAEYEEALETLDVTSFVRYTDYNT
jgi:hypothetical protein